MTIDFSKPITTRDGRAVRILCSDFPHHIYKVVGYIVGSNDLRQWPLDGMTRDYGQSHDLINPPVKRRGWVNISLGAHGGYACGTVWDTQLEAKQAADTRTVATVQLPEWGCAE